ncbi:MAG: flagellum-specific ATP synthase FliI [Acidobacteria bacterium]|nr:MAG: flagellum-specific ATP synthase FliI [Acidobacteriota bacterium]
MNSAMLDLTRFQRRLDEADPLTEFGIVEKVVGNTIESHGPNVTMGCVCWMENQGRRVPVEVVGFTDGKVISMPLGKIDGVKQGDILQASGRTASIGMSEQLQGRVLDGLGRPIDDSPLPLVLDRQDLYAEPANPLSRDPIREPLQTGVRVIDGLLTCGLGQRIGIFGGSGVGKSTLLGMIARYTSADINVIALIGERGREVREFIENELGPEGLKRSIIIVSTSDQPALVRLRAAFAATAAAEYFRDRGYNVMLMMDSVTRFAMAQREVGLAAGEPPSSKGYTPSVFSLLPKLLERTGKFSKGSITAFYTVLVEGDDMNDPIADHVRSILDGHIVSRLMSHLVDSNQKSAAYEIRDLMATYKKSEDLINIGAYKRGSNQRIDTAIDRADAINTFLKQRAEEPSQFSVTQQQLVQLASSGSGVRQLG